MYGQRNPTRQWTCLPYISDHSRAFNGRQSNSSSDQSSTIAGWLLSANTTKQHVYQGKLETFYWQHGEETPQVHTLLPGTIGLAGVVNDKLIPFQFQ
jgi:hypothetical protein